MSALEVTRTIVGPALESTSAAVVTVADAAFLAPSFGIVFVLFWAGLMLLGFGGFVLGVVALINVATTPIERFGPWWDNTRQVWLVGLAVAFVVPAGTIVA